MINTELLITAVCWLILQSTVPVFTCRVTNEAGCTSRLQSFLGENVFLLDLTEVQGVDYLHKPTGILREAMTYWQMPTVQKNRSF